jgi:hypothetical protein
LKWFRYTIIKIRYKSQDFVRVIDNDRLNFIKPDTAQQNIDPKIIKKTSESVNQLSEFAEVGRAEVGGIPQTHLASKIDINEEKTIALNTTTSEKRLPTGEKIRLKIFGTKKQQIITNPYETDPENIKMGGDDFREASGIGMMHKFAGPNLLKKVLATEAVANKSGIIYHISPAGYAPKKLLVGKSYMESAIAKGEITNQELLDAAWTAQTSYNELYELINTFELKHDMLGLIKLHIYDILGLSLIHI